VSGHRAPDPSEVWECGMNPDPDDAREGCDRQQEEWDEEADWVMDES
jgi:hypothetical protein